MDLDGLDIKPAEGTLAVRFMAEEEDGTDPVKQGYVPPTSSPEPTEPRKLAFALVLAVGKKVEAKKGNVVAVSASARKWADKLGDDVYLISSYDVRAICTE